MINHLKRLEITLSVGCKLNCLYCPQALLLRKYGNSKKYLNFEDFKTVVSKVAAGGWIIFNGMSEPFLNKDCLRMLQYASDGGYNISMANRAGNLSFVKGETHEKGRIICSQGKWRTGYIPEMLPDGRVVLCCNDYGMKHVLGNLIEQDWDEIVHGDEWEKILCGWETDYSDILCRKCETITEWSKVNCFSDANMLWPIAIKQGIEIERIRMYGENGNEVLQKVANAKKICIWGLGSYFKEDFFQNGWNEILMPQYFTDSNITEEMKNQLQEKCVDVEKILQMNDILVIIYVKNTQVIEEILKEHKIEYVKIQDIYIS